MGSKHSKRIERLEQSIKNLSCYSDECICFPPNEPPSYAFALEWIMLKWLKCSLHGERFGPLGLHLYVPRWMREKMPRLLLRRSPQYQKAWFATFPPALWPGVEEEAEDESTYLILKDGTRLLAEGPPTWRTDRASSKELVFRSYVDWMKETVQKSETQ